MIKSLFDCMLDVVFFFVIAFFMRECSIHTSNGAIVQHFAPNGKLVFEASEHQAPAAEYQEHTR